MNERIEKVSKAIFFVMIKLTVPGVLLPFFCDTLVNYLILDLGEESFRLPVECHLRWYYMNVYLSTHNTTFCWRWPFGWKTPLGYLAPLVISSFAAFFTCAFAACLMSFFIGLYFTFTSMLKDITNDLRDLNEDKKIADHNCKEVKKQLDDVVLLHSEVQQLSEICCFLPYFEGLMTYSRQNFTTSIDKTYEHCDKCHEYSRIC